MERTSQLRAGQKLTGQTMAQGIIGLPDTYGIPLQLELADMRLESKIPMERLKLTKVC